MYLINTARRLLVAQATQTVRTLKATEGEKKITVVPKIQCSIPYSGDHFYSSLFPLGKPTTPAPYSAVCRLPAREVVTGSSRGIAIRQADAAVLSTPGFGLPTPIHRL